MGTLARLLNTVQRVVGPAVKGAMAAMRTVSTATVRVTPAIIRSAVRVNTAAVGVTRAIIYSLATLAAVAS